MYLRYYDTRFGDYYEVYINDLTGDFEGALRSIESVGRNPIFYDHLKDIPPVQRNAIESLIHTAWEDKLKQPLK